MAMIPKTEIFPKIAFARIYKDYMIVGKINEVIFLPNLVSG